MTVSFTPRKQEFASHCSTTLTSGLEVIAQPMPGVQSVAMAFLVKAGACDESWGVAGLSHLTEATMFRGTKNRSARELNDKLDRLGVSRGSSTGLEMTLFSAVLLGDHLLEALDVFVDVLRYASFPSEDLEAVRALQLQEIGQRNDQPAQLAMDRAREMYFSGHCFANDVLGTPESVTSATREWVTGHWEARYRPNNMVLAIAGKFEWTPLLKKLETLCEGWGRGEAPATPAEPAINPAVAVHDSDIAQENLCFTFPGVRYGDSGYHAAALASTVLGGGMNSRLFAEVREKRGLAYAVGARFDAMSSAGLVRVFAGTQPERAKESVEVIRSELNRLGAGGVTQEELELAKTRLKSRVVMNGETTGNRVMTIARDWFYERRFRTLAEMREQIDGVSRADIDDYLGRVHVGENLGLFALGPVSSHDLGVGDQAFEIDATA